MLSGQSRPPLGKFWPQHVTAWQTWKIGVSAVAVMETVQSPETVSQGQRGNNIIICFQPLPWPRGRSWRAPMILLYTLLHLDYIVRSAGLQWWCISGRARVKTRAACTIVGALYHSGPWLWQAWSWNTGACWEGILYQLNGILTHITCLTAFSWQTNTHSFTQTHICTFTHSQVKEPNAQ